MYLYEFAAGYTQAVLLVNARKSQLASAARSSFCLLYFCAYLYFRQLTLSYANVINLTLQFEL